MDMTSASSIGVGDLQHAMRAEVQRILREAKGDPLAQTKLLYAKLRDLDLVTEAELDQLHRVADVGARASTDADTARTAYFESRSVLNEMIASGQASPVALALASSAVGSYQTNEDPKQPGTVVFAKSQGEWEGRGAAAGAVIGSFWGPGGAAAGAAIGGLVGAAVDECLD